MDTSETPKIPDEPYLQVMFSRVYPTAGHELGASAAASSLGQDFRQSLPDNNRCQVKV